MAAPALSQLAYPPPPYTSIYARVWRAYAHWFGVCDADDECLPRLSGQCPPAPVHNRPRHEDRDRLVLRLENRELFA